LPKVWAQYIEPPLEDAAPTPMAVKLGFSMFARCPEEASQRCMTDSGVAMNEAMFSPQRDVAAG
jgi:hypothetical protein